MCHSFFAVLAALLFLAGCASGPFQPSAMDRAPFMERVVYMTQRTVQVAAAVPTAEETRDLIGLDLYAEGIQPVWLKVTNLGDARVRAAIRSIDEEYFSPMEVAWQFRNKFDKQGRKDMERWFYENQLPRFVPPGATVSGFVYTHTAYGTKGFNFDVYSSRQSFNFTFFIRLPGFVADYMNVNFDSLYQESEIRDVDIDELEAELRSLPCCSTDASGREAGDPINAVLVGTPTAVRRSLLRAGWIETAANAPDTVVARTHHYHGRSPDGTFHKERPDGTERKELRLWLAPIRVGENPVWVGQVSYDMSGATGQDAYKHYRIDPDIDDARMYLLQNFWYTQSLERLAFVSGAPKATIEAQTKNFSGVKYFSDGLRVVLFVSEEPIGMDETRVLQWDALARE